MSLEAGTDVGSYRLQAVLGHGGMGVVYKAFDNRLNRAVAIKFLSNDLADAGARRRFQREAQTASSLSHPHIVAVHDVGEFEGRQFLVTELAGGGTLADWSSVAPRTWREIVELMVGVADAIATAHDAGILHRDIKPGNVLLTSSGYAKLADFGLAKVQESDDSITRVGATRTLPGVVLGTVAYMSPEQASGRPVDARSDIFSFGVVLYELLARRLPFSGPSTIDTMHAILHRPAPPLADTVPVPLRLLVDKALEKDPADRYQSMRDLLIDLRRLLRSSTEATTVATEAAPRRRVLLPVAAGAALVVIGGAVLLVWHPGRVEAPLHVTYAPLTNFSDSVVAPSLSPDGRLLAFIRGENTFDGPGQVYVKLLPEGEPAQLTHDSDRKMGPITFSADGSRLFYTVNTLNTWTVPTLGGEPTRLFNRASSLSWFTPKSGGRRRMLYTAYVDEKSLLMGVYTADEDRSNERPVYIPADENGMAHRAFLSPDQQHVLIVEMNMTGWQPCRVVPLEGRSAGVQVGPIPAQCTDAAWSPDGQWMYLSANNGTGFHIWRQRFPGGTPEQVTSGATEEQGLAVDPDGKSLVTSMGDRQSTLWVHDHETRQVTFEGFAYTPLFSADGSRLYYLQRSTQDRRFVAGELWTVSLQTGKRERLLPDQLMESYDISADGTTVVFVRVDANGVSSIWEGRLDGSAAPRRLSSLSAIRVLYGIGDDVVFVGGEAPSLFLYRVSRQGGTPQKIVLTPVNYLYAVSPDGKWLAAWAGLSVAFYPIDGGAPRLICKYCGTAGEENRGVTPPLVRWSSDGHRLYLHSTGSKSTYVVALPAAQMVPTLPEGGFAEIDEMAKALGGQPLPDARAYVSNDPGVYAFPRVSSHRNIYRVSLQ